MQQLVHGRGAAPDDFERQLIGHSPSMRALRERIARLAPYDEPVLVLGETGTGKELVARSLHDYGSRASEAIQIIHCAGVGSDLLAAELFGHSAGAFTGANADRDGRIRAGHRSTVVLDEITETPESFQAALLRVIENGEVQPVGRDRAVPVDVRFVATSNRSLEDIASGKALRRDLYHRLAAFVVEIPPLRERAEDIPHIAEHFLDELAARYGVTRRLTPGAVDLLTGQPFPGNVRELRQVIVRAYVEAPDRRLDTDVTRSALNASTTDIAEAAGSFGSLEELIRHHIRRTLASTDGNLSRAARALEIPRSTLQHYLVKYRVEAPSERPRREATN